MQLINYGIVRLQLFSAHADVLNFANPNCQLNFHCFDLAAEATKNGRIILREYKNYFLPKSLLILLGLNANMSVSSLCRPFKVSAVSSKMSNWVLF
jgi:hypothetical protein